MSHRKKCPPFTGLPRSDVDEVKRFQKFLEKRAAGDPTGGETAAYLGLTDEQHAILNAAPPPPAGEVVK